METHKHSETSNNKNFTEQTWATLL